MKKFFVIYVGCIFLTIVISAINLLVRQNIIIALIIQGVIMSVPVYFIVNLEERVKAVEKRFEEVTTVTSEK